MNWLPFFKKSQAHSAPTGPVIRLIMGSYQLLHYSQNSQAQAMVDSLLSDHPLADLIKPYIYYTRSINSLPFSPDHIVLIHAENASGESPGWSAPRSIIEDFIQFVERRYGFETNFSMEGWYTGERFEFTSLKVMPTSELRPRMPLSPFSPVA